MIICQVSNDGYHYKDVRHQNKCSNVWKCNELEDKRGKKEDCLQILSVKLYTDRPTIRTLAKSRSATLRALRVKRTSFGVGVGVGVWVVVVVVVLAAGGV